MTQADHYFITRSEMTHLTAKLNHIPSLEDDLVIATTRQAVIARRGLGSPRRPKKRESQLPFHIGASSAAIDLQNSLALAIRHTLESRGLPYDGGNSLSGMAKWLSRNVIAFAMTEGAPEFADEIVYCSDRCVREVDLPPDDEVVIDRARVRDANRQVLTAGQVEKIAPRLGDLGRGLNKRRVETLNRNQLLWPCVSLIKGDPKFYRLGDVLDAHHRHAQRTRKKTA